jgi:glycosyltransferase involved in cell wall biosynthesis
MTPVVFSFIIPTLNEELYVPRLLESLTKQKGDDFEVIVVDACSKDETVHRAQSFANSLPHLSVIVNSKASASFQRNKGAHAAKGKWLIFVDADTVLLPDFLTTIRAYIEKVHPVFFTTWLVTDEKGLFNIFISVVVNFCYEILLHIGRPMAPGPLSVIARDTFFSIGQYDVTRRYGEDYDLSLRARRNHIRFQLLPRALYVMSCRRMRRNGYIRMTILYLWTTSRGAISGNVAQSVPGYETGGHVYRS